MKLTAIQLRHIIKEEVQKVVRASKKRHLREAYSQRYIEIPDVKAHATKSGMSLQSFIRTVEEIANNYESLKDDIEYNEEYDTIGGGGDKSELESFALELDRRFIPVDIHGDNPAIESYFEQFIKDD